MWTICCPQGGLFKEFFQHGLGVETGLVLEKEFDALGGSVVIRFVPFRILHVISWTNEEGVR